MKFTHLLLLTMLGIILAEPLQAQVERTMQFDANDSFMLRELSAMIVQNDTGLQVEVVMGNHSAKANQMEDRLQRGDIVLMMNGKRVSEASELKVLYNALADGELIKIGVRRNNARFIVSAEKGDVPENAPGQMVLSFDTDNGTPPTIIPELGVLLTDNEKGVEIMSVLAPLLPQDLQEIELENHFIKKINNRFFDDSKSIQNFLAALKVGDSITIELEKNGVINELSITKQAPRGNVRLSIEN